MRQIRKNAPKLEMFMRKIIGKNNISDVGSTDFADSADTVDSADSVASAVFLAVQNS